MNLRRLGWCALLVLGCQRDREREHVAPTRASATPAAASGSAAPSVSGNAAGVAAAKLAPLERAGAVVRAWDAALNRHDAAALAALYAPSVSFYGQTLPREKLVESKKKALGASPDFEQSLSNLNLASEADGSVSATFTKRSGPAKAQREVAARLRLNELNGNYVIALESDAPTDARSDDNRSCMEVAMATAYALPEVDKLFKEAPADARPGGLSFPEEAGRESAAIGFHHDDRFESVFYVEVQNGDLTVSEYGEPLKIPSAARARVRAKCAAP